MIFFLKPARVPADHVGLRAPGAPGEQGAGEPVEGAAGQEHQRGRLQPHAGGAGRGTGPLLPADPGGRAEADRVGFDLSIGPRGCCL